MYGPGLWIIAENKKNISYPKLPSAIRPVAHSSDLPVPKPPTTLPNSTDDHFESSADSYASDSKDYACNMEPHLINQKDLNDLTRD